EQRGLHSSEQYTARVVLWNGCSNSRPHPSHSRWCDCPDATRKSTRTDHVLPLQSRFSDTLWEPPRFKVVRRIFPLRLYIRPREPGTTRSTLRTRSWLETS